MDNNVCWLITLLTVEGTLLECAIKISTDDLSDDERLYPMEPDTREALHAKLPLHVRSIGPIVDVEPIFEIIA